MGAPARQHQLSKCGSNILACICLEIPNRHRSVAPAYSGCAPTVSPPLQEELIISNMRTYRNLKKMVMLALLHFPVHNLSISGRCLNSLDRYYAGKETSHYVQLDDCFSVCLIYSVIWPFESNISATLLEALQFFDSWFSSPQIMVFQPLFLSKGAQTKYVLYYQLVKIFLTTPLIANDSRLAFALYWKWKTTFFCANIYTKKL